ncbi:undecaprenyldiphospho-muramoylpentapeptide beta-N-acetylglucosaminyltransferase [Thermoactinomyces daqus]|uniref:UDP-N-acetylglucosamine--N-acetylmuramyl-(pentapeptide) pyrophosphoryl-undecaprenol N-acetylglucosamine transferase n=1 Tax=Thermoactinomyces daqus TaxID=1329516 RepID=A0A7W1X959_9BACL|nr:undecaprenyldiphospho-muramoylpentapeptide beta-N-acetylglucosaminyltransferase [Thermoactinomyces daqus]MBH8598275.1 undecaprenyldiphospho-muramoylpentapeptide beta-N-acetylglucosaminyltransferase [Thermoactinomyces sp. CICC 10523]MBH8604398.1 undecaprenyldiphospho-muramoylpentapeptide beta-N-acetylglucosaminyltransferase [Thermoactinomyces sp. CICC 10522]
MWLVKKLLKWIYSKRQKRKGGFSLRKSILFTGGGTAGHVTVNLALIPHFLREGWEVEYIGSENGIEKQLIAGLDQVRYHAISTGKLRRYFDWNNFKDPFRVLKGIFQAYRLIRRQKPGLIFSKGGFVSVPVVIGGWLNRVPVIIHESDLTPGLANKLATPFASKVITTFPETTRYFKSDRAEYVGAVIREELKQGDREQGLAICRFSPNKPVLLIMGGSLGAKRINEAVRENLVSLLEQFQIVHICGKGQVDSSLQFEGYKQFEYVSDELPHLMNMADLVISRAGSNSIFEFLALRKPMLLIPLSKAASRGDQILNAESFKKMGYCDVLQEEEMTAETFLNAVFRLFDRRAEVVAQMEKNEGEDPRDKVIRMIEELAKA